MHLHIDILLGNIERSEHGDLDRIVAGKLEFGLWQDGHVECEFLTLNRIRFRVDARGGHRDDVLLIECERNEIADDRRRNRITRLFGAHRVVDLLQRGFAFEAPQLKLVDEHIKTIGEGFIDFLGRCSDGKFEFAVFLFDLFDFHYLACLTEVASLAISARAANA